MNCCDPYLRIDAALLQCYSTCFAMVNFFGHEQSKPTPVGMEPEPSILTKSSDSSFAPPAPCLNQFSQQLQS